MVSSLESFAFAVKLNVRCAGEVQRWGSGDPSSVTYQGGPESVWTIQSERGDGIAARGSSGANEDDSGWHYL